MGEEVSQVSDAVDVCVVAAVTKWRETSDRIFSL